MRYQSWGTSVLQVPSTPRFSRVVELRSRISTLLRVPSSSADPEKVSGLPGATTCVGAAVGGSIVVGALIDTVGAAPSSLTIQERSPVSRSDSPSVSMARALAFQVPSTGTVISLDHVVFLAPTTSGVIRKV